MDNNTINIDLVAKVAATLQDINQDVVFVGGAAVSLYTDDPAANEFRPTQDIDLALHIASLNHWQIIQEQLRLLGFFPDPFGHAICSYKYKDIPIDILSTEDGPLGPTNKWYKIGFENLWTAKVKDQEIKILSAPCYLATKFEAFNNRGTDYRTSHDIEDIIFILDNRMKIVSEIKTDDPKIVSFLKEQFQTIIQKGLLQEVLIAHIHPFVLEDRIQVIEEKINHIIL